MQYCHPDGGKRTSSQPDNVTGPDAQNVLEKCDEEIVRDQRKEKALRLTALARGKELSREIIWGVLERVETSIMVKSIILEEVDKVD